MTLHRWETEVLEILSGYSWYFVQIHLYAPLHLRIHFSRLGVWQNLLQVLCKLRFLYNEDGRQSFRFDMHEIVSRCVQIQESRTWRFQLRNGHREHKAVLGIYPSVRTNIVAWAEKRKEIERGKNRKQEDFL